MVANTDTTFANIPFPTNNYLISSTKMNLPANLLRSIEFWTKEDVQKWIEYCIEEYSLGDINLNDFEMNGKALSLLSEDGFKQRSARSGDILYKALQQHYALIKSFNCQTLSYQLWNSFGFLPPSSVRHFNLPFPPVPPPNMPYLHPAMNYLYNQCEAKYTAASIASQQLTRTRQTSECSSSSSPVTKPLEKHDMSLPISSIKEEYMDDEDIDIEQHESASKPPLLPPPLLVKSQANERKIHVGSDSARQIRYYQDRIDFHGDILMKPKAAKNCRILWEFLYILLEDPLYESIIHWENREKMVFRINQADKLAALWGLQKNRLSMTYEKLSRGMRYYYSNNIISKEQSKRLLYRFMRSPDEIRKNMKRQSSSANTFYSSASKASLLSETNLQRSEPSVPSQLSNQFLHLLPNYSSMISSNYLFPTRDKPISKSDRASSSSPESLDSSHHESEKQYSCSSTAKRKQTIPISLTSRLLHGYPFDQPLNLAVSCKQEEHMTDSKNT
ncbi:unnamed protein product [Adineta ricciae]|uniref:Uncharacterized protein n=1 Tax=Adineta ricciae TaxID=249248 RepID=A0A815K4S7_ADIRI|nr:unnamed protein product [Adineta ricciae]CAF1386401.1 unnamed protein product [Adineta ricciae]